MLQKEKKKREIQFLDSWTIDILFQQIEQNSKCCVLCGLIHSANLLKLADCQKINEFLLGLLICFVLK